MPDFIPRSDLAVEAWSRTFRDELLKGYQQFDLPLERVQAYAQLYAAYADELKRAGQPSHRTTLQIMRKDRARDALIEDARWIARHLRSLPTLDPTQRQVLGLTVSKHRAARIGVVDHAPELMLVDCRDGQVRIRLRDRSQPLRRGKPSDVAGAIIYGHHGPREPQTPGEWRVLGTTSRPDCWVSFGDDHEPGTKVYICAAWLSPRLQPGPVSRPPVMTHLVGKTILPAKSLKAA